MNIELAAIVVSATTVVIAEMGDKTQLLAMAFALRYPWWKVMIGVLGATILNHALAVAVGSILGNIQSAHVVIQVLASASFILFGLWTLKGDELGDEAKKKTRFGPIITVAIAFFIAEMGDKTQLATIALAAKYPSSPAGTLIGTTTGMLIADGIGIVVGVVLCKKIPERAIKIGAAALFMLFGLASTLDLLIEELALGLGLSIGIIAALAAGAAAISYRIVKTNPIVQESGPLVPGACEDTAAESAQ